jgi:hypothetical protein
MRYEEIDPIPRDQAETMLANGTSEDKTRALLSVALNGEDRTWVQQWCLDLLESDDPQVRRIAVVCLGHLARIHGEIDHATVVPRLRRLSSDPAVAGDAENALEDIEIFTRR